MPKLTVTSLVTPSGLYPAYWASAIQIQDPFPAEGRLVLQIMPGTTASVTLNMDQLQRLRSQLLYLQQNGSIDYTVESADEDPRTEEADLMGGTTIDYMDTGTTPLTNGASNVGAILTGSNMLMGYVQAYLHMVDSVSPLTDYMNIVSIDPGIAAHETGIILENDAGVVAPSGVEYDDVAPVPTGYTRVLRIRILPATFSWTTLAAVLADPVAGIYAVTSLLPGGAFRLQIGTSAGAVTAPVDQALAPLAGGEGVPLMLTVGDTSAVITNQSNTAIQYDLDLTASAMALGDTASVVLRASGGGPSASASVVIA